MKPPLLTDFYQETSSDHSEHSADFNCRIRLNPSHEVYKGHFANFPVTPGVCLIQIIKEVLAGKLRKELLLKSGDNIKFLMIIDPNETGDLNLHFLLKQDGENIRVSAVYSSGGNTYVKFKGEFVVAG